MSVVIITGSSGLVGSESVEFFCKKGFDVVGIDNNLRNHFFGKDGSTIWVKKKLLNKHKNFKSNNIDIRNFNSIEQIFKKYKKNISLIIHCAAQPSHDYGKKFPILDFNVNATGTLNLLELTKKYCSDSPFIFMSTNKVYGDNPNKLKIIEKSKRWELKEKDIFYKGIDEKFSIDNCTHSFFGVSKTYADLIVQEYGKNIGLKTVSFRGGCITGPNHSGAKLHGFLSYLVKSSLTKKSYTLIGYKGKQVRDNLHSFDLVNCFWEFYKKPKNGEVYNMGGGRYSNCSIIEALDIVEKLKGIKIKKEIITKNRVGDHIWYVSNTKKFKKDYPKWKQKYNTKKIIEELIENN
ncbi:NAD-dependent epimerase/dehydratase family protein [Candidatus Pelagibacter sp.]|nr:NAD-dependent epimerase/dehydratase family protein [Candidatus Pelagibacter bacterium]MDB9808253.1 NAD-dependent epimerase/dehydratase family protein [Candidatus Pelagibacter sp.]MDC1082518.1 NAD-dependent epimerase/dehydratase family protein [Candidatus Pelagibacter sp.]